MSPTEDGVTIVYDGDCPFCSAFVTMARLREAAGPVMLVDARQSPELAVRLTAEGYDLDEGMVVLVGGRAYFGAEAVNAIALMSSRSTVFNRAVAAVFERPRIAAALYPPMRAGRNLVLRLLGRRRFSETKKGL